MLWWSTALSLSASVTSLVDTPLPRVHGALDTYKPTMVLVLLALLIEHGAMPSRRISA